MGVSGQKCISGVDKAEGGQITVFICLAIYFYLPPPREDPQQPTQMTQDGEEIRTKRDKRKNKMAPVY